MKRIPKSQFKPRAFEYLRMVQDEGEPLIITDHGRDAVRLEPVADSGANSADTLSGVIEAWERPLDPVDDGSWEAER